MKDRFPMHLQDCLFFKQEFKFKVVCFTGARFEGKMLLDLVMVKQSGIQMGTLHFLEVS